jgi:hypothetical protein
MKAQFCMKQMTLPFWKSPLLSGTVLILLLTTGCQSERQDSFYIDQYFDLKSLIDRQISYYADSAKQGKLTKTVAFDSDTETKTQDIQNIDQVRDILETAIINKPGLRGVYKENWDYGLNDEGDTLYSVLSNTLKPEEDALVKEIKAFYKGPPAQNNLYRIHVFKKTDNILYENAQYLEMKFRNGLMTSLSMEGRQQILNFDQERYGLSLEIKAE